jgi:hypothetical protein
VETVEEEKKRQPSVLRTFRLSSALDEALAKEAEEKKIGKNALVVSILSKHKEWDSIVEKFSYLTVPPEMVVMLVRSLDKDTVTSVAKTVSKKVASSLPLWYGTADLTSLLDYFETSVKYSGARLPQRIEKKGKEVRIISYQPYDENGRAWARAFMSEMIENVLGYPPKIIEHPDSIETIIELKE